MSKSHGSVLLLLGGRKSPLVFPGAGEERVFFSLPHSPLQRVSRSGCCYLWLFGCVIDGLSPAALFSALCKSVLLKWNGLGITFCASVFLSMRSANWMCPTLRKLPTWALCCFTLSFKEKSVIKWSIFNVEILLHLSVLYLCFLLGWSLLHLICLRVLV